MTVAELIQKLSTMPQDAVCMSFEFEASDFVPIAAVEHDPKDIRNPVFFKTDWDIHEEQG